ncbi:MAG: tyrosine-type recombinase/integrase [Lachnospiraceae bacterium]|nr:tyrosine-type recombinase/integrase [Lachnospiraceae bacterium]
MGKTQKNNDILMEEFVSAAWLPHVQAHKASWKIDEHTARNHILPVFGGKPIASITEADIRQWLTGYEKQRCALSTRNRRLHVLKSIFNFAVEKGLLEEAPTAKIRSKRIKKTRWPSLDRKYLSSLLDALNKSPKKEAKAITLLLLTGAHKSEIIKARWENLFLEEGVLLVPRAGMPPYRRIWLSTEAKEILRSIPRRADSPWIFPGRNVSKPLSDIFLFWKELRTELGLEALSIRDLRYVFADWQLRTGVPLAVVQRSLGINDMREVNKHMFHLPSEVVHA